MTGPETFLTNEEARYEYALCEKDNTLASKLDQDLAANGVANIEMPVSDGDFETLIHSYETCIDKYPDLLAETYVKVDKRHGNEAGHVRKERKIDPETGLQRQDPKSLIHFNELASGWWSEQFAKAPQEFRQFLGQGAEIHRALVKVAFNQFVELEYTHPNITRAYYPKVDGVRTSYSFMRVLSYDDYPADTSLGDVAKPHFDIGGATIQAYADASGFWGSKDGPKGERVFHESAKGYGQFFMGIGHRKLYGRDTRLQPLWHGVARLVPEGVTHVPKRHAVILFNDAPRVDYAVTDADTLPQLNQNGDADDNSY